MWVDLPDPTVPIKAITRDSDMAEPPKLSKVEANEFLSLLHV
jgi:hypothetical protein